MHINVYVYIGSLKVCNVRYILSYKHYILSFTPEMQLRIAFYCSVSIECSIMVEKSKRMVLHANMQFEIVLTIFTIFMG